jgi:hypothetical protein
VIIYQARQEPVLHHALRDDIEDVVVAALPERDWPWRRAIGDAVVEALAAGDGQGAAGRGDSEDAGVAIEYQLPQSSKRIDFVITGEDSPARTKVVIVELKQWSQSRRSEKDAIVWARRGGRRAELEGPHPSYQAWSYAAYLQDFNSAVQDGAMSAAALRLPAQPSARRRDRPSALPRAPGARAAVPGPRARQTAGLHPRARAPRRPQEVRCMRSKRADPAFEAADRQRGWAAARQAGVRADRRPEGGPREHPAGRTSAQATERKQVVIVQGGPGTGKSVMAINLLGP